MNELEPFAIKSPLITKSFPINVVDVGLPNKTVFGEEPASANILAVIILANDEKIMEKASTWVVNFVGTVRPIVTYIFIFELCAINAWIAYYVYSRPSLVTNMDDLIRVTDIIFSSDEMAMLGGIIGFWFGSRSWSKK